MSLEQITQKEFKPSLLQRFRSAFRSYGFAFLLASSPFLFSTCGSDEAKPVASGCTADDECKSNRICYQGKCIFPNEVPDGGQPDASQPTCNDECSSDGEKQCFENSYKTCGNYDSDSCLDWSSLTSCSSGEYCETGECKTQTPTCIDDDSDSYGLNCPAGEDCDDNNSSVHQKINCDYNGTSCGNYQLCVEECPLPPEEICDGIDNNCINGVDEGCGCINRETQQCGQTDIGECSYGTQTCSNGSWGSCVGVVNPTNEICNNKDDDCNSSTDENLTRNCSSACGSGLETCISGSWQNCTAPQPPNEICDNLDNDCDGLVDENNVCGLMCLASDSVFCDDFETAPLDPPNNNAWAVCLTVGMGENYGINEGLLKINYNDGNEGVGFCSSYEGIIRNAFEIEAKIKIEGSSRAWLGFHGYLHCEIGENYCCCGDFVDSCELCDNPPQDVSNWHLYKIIATNQTFDLFTDGEQITHYTHEGPQQVLVGGYVINNGDVCYFDYVKATSR